MLKVGSALLMCLMIFKFSYASESIQTQLGGDPLSLNEFVIHSTQNDTEFEQILIDDLILNYQKDLRLPARDIVLSVKQEYHYFIEHNKERGETSVSLSHLFPMSGTEIEGSYSSTPVSATARNSSQISFSITQSIAENAFGKSTRLLDQIIGLEVEVARHQVTEAYEDYLATIILEYLKWVESFENLKIGISSYQENLKLLKNIKERQESKIALPIDVHKVEIQVIEKQESLINFYYTYKNQLNTIRRIMRSDMEKNMTPYSESDEDDFSGEFESIYLNFKSESRTYQIFDLLEKRSEFQVERDADDLLPSISLTAGYQVEGTDYNLEDNDRLFYAGIQTDWPFPDAVERAEYEISRLKSKKTKTQNINTHHRLYSTLKNIFEQIMKEKELKAIAEEKVRFAKSVLKDETENYTFGKVTLNDYIRAVNALDGARFNLVLRKIQIRKLHLEWKRLTDTLITSQEIRAAIKD